MSDFAVEIPILLGVTAGVAILWHGLVKNYLLASVGAALTAMAAIQVLLYVHQGYLGLFYVISLVVSALLCIPLSLIIGLPFLSSRTRKERNRLRNGHGKQETSSRTPKVDRR